MTLARNYTGEGRILTGAEAAPFESVVRRHLPGRVVQSVKDRGEWVRRIVEVTLDGGEVVFIKMDLSRDHPGWLQSKDGEWHDRDVEQLFARNGMDAVIPPVLAVDYSCEILSHPFAIQARRGGTRLGDLVERATDAEADAIYAALGAFYRRLHSIHNDCPGVWNGSTPDKPWGDPAGYMFQSEVVEGCGKRALDEGRISQGTYGRAVAAWQANMEYMHDYAPSLIHYSAFHWNVYLEGGDGSWRVSKIMSVGDVMWWDSACDLACIQYPPFGDATKVRWESFLRAYGPPPERKRALLFVVMQRLCAAMGSYYELTSEANEAWAMGALDELDGIVDEIETL